MKKIFYLVYISVASALYNNNTNQKKGGKYSRGSQDDLVYGEVA